jgi:adenylosuccinate synthase
MAKTADAVIGAGFGDEGKGLMADYFCSLQNPDKAIVARFNGGAQAGHTVVLPDGRRHVFSHFGAGTFQNVDTYLSNDFIVNPILFLKELDILKSSTRIFVGSECRITTPYDMLVNQCVETSRIDRHGSCGVGIFETMTRDKEIKFSMKSISTLTFSTCREILEEIQERAYKKIRNLAAFQRFEELMFLDFSEKFYRDLKTMLDQRIFVVDENHAFALHDHVIFEGAQGLLLNEKYGAAPHLTPSDTGCFTPLTLCDLNEVEHMNICYVTRAYTTRHGAGYLHNELSAEELKLSNIENETNVHNEYQGNFRYAKLKTIDIANAISKDFDQSKQFNVKCKKQIAMTCLDQLPRVNDANLNKVVLKQMLKPTKFFESFGPTRNHIRESK